MGASTAGGGCKNRDFRPISSFITDMIQHKAILLNVEIGTGMQSTATEDFQRYGAPRGVFATAQLLVCIVMWILANTW